MDVDTDEAPKKNWSRTGGRDGEGCFTVWIDDSFEGTGSLVGSRGPGIHS